MSESFSFLFALLLFLVSHGVVGSSLFNNYIVQFQKRSSSVLLSKYGGVARGGGVLGCP